MFSPLSQASQNSWFPSFIKIGQADGPTILLFSLSFQHATNYPALFNLLLHLRHRPKGDAL